MPLLVLMHRVLAILLICSCVIAQQWQQSSDAIWALNCDFQGNDIGNVRVPGDQCSRACGRRTGCTHFAWTTYQGGTCWLKSSSSVSQGSATRNNSPGSVCGIMRSQSPPSPPSPPNPPSGARFTITNGCSSQPIWIANFANNRPYFTQNIKLDPGQRVPFQIPPEGLAATRFWAKSGCDASGSNCDIGQSGGPGQNCPAAGCAPPVDTKFEATFGCSLPKAQCAGNPSAPGQKLLNEDFWNLSLVDGWTFPFSLTVVGNCPGYPSSINCRGLGLAQCPRDENAGRQLDLIVRNPANRRASGCYSPCGKLTYRQWNPGFGFSPGSPQARPYCCPPPTTPEQCSAGAISRTKYVASVHRHCPNVYAYSYDDGIGLAKCPVGTSYRLTFYCPN